MNNARKLDIMNDFLTSNEEALEKLTEEEIHALMQFMFEVVDYSIDDALFAAKVDPELHQRIQVQFGL